MNAAGRRAPDRFEKDRGSGPEAGVGADHWLARPENVRRVRAAFGLALAATLIPDFFIEQHADFGVEDGFGFYAWFGFLTCIGMVLAAKGLGAFLKRGDRYYGD